MPGEIPVDDGVGKEIVRQPSSWMTRDDHDERGVGTCEVVKGDMKGLNGDVYGMLWDFMGLYGI